MWPSSGAGNEHRRSRHADFDDAHGENDDQEDLVMWPSQKVASTKKRSKSARHFSSQNQDDYSDDDGGHHYRSIQRVASSPRRRAPAVPFAQQRSAPWLDYDEMPAAGKASKGAGNSGMNNQ